MGWATHCITRLKNGETVSFRPHGNSMKGCIKSGQLCTVEPIDGPISIQVGDIVLCKVKGKEYLHFILAIKNMQTYQIGNNLGGINSIYGKLIKIED